MEFSDYQAAAKVEAFALCPHERLADAALAWRNGDLVFPGTDEEVVERFAWHIPVVKAGSRNAPVRQLHVERYGGGGIHRNGGGARAFYSDDYVVKGAGINCLTGYTRSVQKERLFGYCTLAASVEEALWGEFFHAALPHGAARNLAVIESRAQAPQGYEFLMRDTARGLAVRQFKWRPAHFMRAPYFNPGDTIARKLVPDAERVRRLIVMLPFLLPTPRTLSETDLASATPDYRLVHGLAEVAYRFAEQMAFAHANRLMHGTITSSNICLDGAWIDFNTSSLLPGYGDIEGFRPFTREYEQLKHELDALLFYVNKYFHNERADSVPLPNGTWLSNIYHEMVESELTINFVMLCGFPRSMIEVVARDPQARVELYALRQCMMRLSRLGHDRWRPHARYPRDRKGFGTFNLGDICLELHRQRISPDAFPYSDHPILFSTLLETYRTIASRVKAAARSAGISEPAFDHLTLLNCIRYNKERPLLYKENLCDHVYEMVAQCTNAGEVREAATGTIEAIRREAHAVYGDRNGFSVRLWVDKNVEVRFCAAANQYLVKRDRTGAGIEKAVGGLDGLMNMAANDSGLKGFFTFWNDTVEQFSHA